MAMITVQAVCDQGFRIESRGHALFVDQPHGESVSLGPTPIELFVMSVASCAAHYAVAYLRKNDLPHRDLRVECMWNMRPEPARVGRIDLKVLPPSPLDAEHVTGMLAAVNHCTVHNSLRMPPEVHISEASTVG